MENYNLELGKIIKIINKNRSKLVCIQLPDGLKPKAREIQQHIEKNTKASVVIWLGSCYGACDIPVTTKKLGVDLLIQWGHSEFIKSW